MPPHWKINKSIFTKNKTKGCLPFSSNMLLLALSPSFQSLIVVAVVLFLNLKGSPPCFSSLKGFRMVSVLSWVPVWTNLFKLTKVSVAFSDCTRDLPLSDCSQFGVGGSRLLLLRWCNRTGRWLSHVRSCTISSVTTYYTTDSVIKARAPPGPQVLDVKQGETRQGVGGLGRERRLRRLQETGVGQSKVGHPTATATPSLTGGSTDSAAASF